jgi:stress response protein YsnF
MSSELPSAGESRIPIHAEELSISRRQAAGATLRASTVTREDEHLVDEMLTHQRVEIERIPIDRPVDVMPPVRQEGDTTILSVVEETIIVERRLILKEEVRIRRLHILQRHQEAVVLRQQEAVITRVEPSKADRSDIQEK